MAVEEEQKGTSSVCNLSSNASSISTGITSDESCDHRIQDEDNNLHTGSNSSLNIQVDTCTSGNTNSDIPGVAGISPPQGFAPPGARSQVIWPPFWDLAPPKF